MLTIHHIAITATNLKLSSQFYDAVLKPFGYVRHFSDETACSWVSPKSSQPEFLVYAAKPEQIKNEHILYNPGVHHYCFKVDEKHLIDEVFLIAKDFGVEILDTPTEYPRYAKNVDSKSYYAVFFTDPSNIKLEFAWMPK
ncbi:MAG: VOC family protein [bacterium]